MMLTDMQLLWIQYWTALPVIVEDRDMNDGSQLGGRMASSTFPLDPSSQYRLSESEEDTRTFYSIALGTLKEWRIYCQCYTLTH